MNDQPEETEMGPDVYIKSNDQVFTEYQRHSTQFSRKST